MTLFFIKNIYRKKYQYLTTPGKDDNKKTYGIKSLPLWDVEPAKFVVLLLHLEIGLVNKVWSDFNYFLRNEVDFINDNERRMRNKLNELQQRFKINSDQVSLYIKIEEENYNN